MSLYGSMRTSVAGMNAQSSRLGTIADNIANASTTGYKRVETEFSSLVRERSSELSRYESGGVTTRVRQRVSSQGTLEFTTGATDLAIAGDGFFLVQTPNGERVLTRAGSFVPDREGRLVNAAGHALLGQPAGTPPGNGGELAPVDLASEALRAEPSTRGRLVVNLDAGADVVPASDLPTANAASAAPSARTSILAYGAKGQETLLDVHFAKKPSAAGGENIYEVSVFARGGASDPGPFPYADNPSGPNGSGPAQPALLGTVELAFDPASGRLVPTSPDAMTVRLPDADVPAGDWPAVELDLSLTSQLPAEFTVREMSVDGHAPSAIERVEITADGTLRAIYATGTAAPIYDIPLASVVSPDRLAALPGNVYAATQESGLVTVGRAESGALGTIVSGALESSNVDIAAELTDMIESQRSFTANSKVFQTGSELMDVIVNLKR